MLILLIILLLVGVWVISGGSRQSDSMYVLELMGPYTKQYGTKDIESYLEESYDYTSYGIKRMKRKSKRLKPDVGAKQAYLYYLITDIMDKNKYSPYEFLQEADIEFSKCAPDVTFRSRKHTKKEEAEIKKILKDMGLTYTPAEFRKFVKTPYLKKIGNKLSIDELAVMGQAYNEFYEEVRVKPVPVIVPKQPTLRDLILARELQNERDAAKLLYERRHLQAREQELARREQEAKHKNIVDVQKHQVELFQYALDTNQELRNWYQDTIDSGVSYDDAFVMWLTGHPSLADYGAPTGQRFVGGNETAYNIPDEIDGMLKEIHNNIYGRQ